MRKLYLVWALQSSKSTEKRTPVNPTKQGEAGVNNHTFIHPFIMWQISVWKTFWNFFKKWPTSIKKQVLACTSCLWRTANILNANPTFNMTFQIGFIAYQQKFPRLPSQSERTTFRYLALWLCVRIDFLEQILNHVSVVNMGLSVHTLQWDYSNLSRWIIDSRLNRGTLGSVCDSDRFFKKSILQNAHQVLYALLAHYKKWNSNHLITVLNLM